MSTARRRVVSLMALVRTAWIIGGATVALLVLIEGCFRIQRARKDRAGQELPQGDPRRTVAWYADFMKDFDATRSMRWRPYMYFARQASYHGHYVNIDSVGHRVTPQPSSPSSPAARVFFMGGSTMWGNAQRDSFTIPAIASRRLQAVVGPGRRVEVTNFGDNAYVMTQGILQLMLELRGGNRPDAVVFYVGLNDAGSTVQWGAPGVPQNEIRRVADFERGRALDRTGFQRGFKKDARALLVIAGEAVKLSEVFHWAQARTAQPQRTFIPVDVAARGTVRVFVENIRLVDALAAHYGFTPLYVWQPSPHATRKPLTPYEARILETIRADPFQNHLRQVHLAILGLLDSAMHDVAPGRFVDANSLFRDDTTHIFVDWIGHTSEAANGPIVDAFFPQLAAAVTRSRQHRPTHASPAVPTGPD